MIKKVSFIIIINFFLIISLFYNHKTVNFLQYKKKMKSLENEEHLTTLNGDLFLQIKYEGLFEKNLNC